MTPRSRSIPFWSTPVLMILAMLAAPAAAADSAAARELGRIQSDRLNEASGMAASHQNPGILWMHNDGAAHELFAVDTSGRVVALVRLPAQITDLEDMAIGPGPEQGVDYLYLGDIGDNDKDRNEVRVLRLPEPKLQPGTGDQLMAHGMETIRLTYPKRSYNAEALLVDPASGDLLIVTKEKKRARIFVARADQLRDGSAKELEKVGDLKLNLVSGGDISRDGGQVILRRENRGWLWERRAGETIVDALEGKPLEVPARMKGQSANGESVAFHPGGDGYYTVSEGERELIGLFPIGPKSQE